MTRNDLWQIIMEYYSSAMAGFGITLLVQSTVLLAAALLAAWLLRRRGSAVQALVLRCALLAVIALPLVAWAAGRAGVSGLQVGSGQASHQTQPIATPVDAAFPEHRTATPASHDAHDSVAGAPASKDHARAAANAPPAATLPQAPGIETGAISSRFVAAAVSVVWIIGLMLLLIRQMIAMVMVAAARRAAVRAPEQWNVLCTELALRLNIAPPPVLLSDRVDGPCLVGWWRAAILLPMQPGAPRRDVLLHELAHLKRGDCRWQMLARLTAAVLWPQPLVWLLARRIEQLADEICDDIVILHGGDRAGYARELVDLAERQQPGWLAAAPVVGVVASKSAVGRRVMLIMDRSRALVASANRRAAVMVVTGSVCGAIIIGALGARAGSAAESPQIGEDSVTVRGRVLDPDGRPVANSRVTAAVPRALWDRELPREPLAATTTGRDGRFELTFPKFTPFALAGGEPGHDLWKRTKIVTAADGFGLTWDFWDETDEAGNVVLRLVPDMAVEGRVLNHEGRPVEGVTIHVFSYGPPDPKEAYLQYRGDRRAIERQNLSFPMEALGQHSPTTDTDGRFRIDGVGPERSVTLFLQHPQIAYSRVDLITREMEMVVERLEHPVGFVERVETYGRSFEYRADAAVSIVGTVRDENGEPLAGMPVMSRWFATPSNRGMRASTRGLIETVTDEQGRYRLDGFPAGEGNEVIVVPTDDQPHFLYMKDVPNEPGPVTVDFTMSRAVWITGTVTDKVTGEPVPVRVAYVPMLGNERAIEIPEYEEERGPAHPALTVYQSRYIPKPDGTFRVPGVPGRGIVYVMDYSHRYRRGIDLDELPWIERDEHGWYNVYQPFWDPTGMWNAAAQVEADENGAHVDLQLDPGQSITVTVVDPDGQPIGNLHVRGHVPEQYYAWAELLEPATFEAIGFAPDETRTFFLHDRQRGLGKATAISPADAPNGVTIQLEPIATITGRLLDPEGEPLPRMWIRPTSHLPDRRSLQYAETDEQGWFELVLLPGSDYTLYAESTARLSPPLQKLDDVSPEPGERIELGDIELEVKE